jgi:hypothetical protein
MSILSALRAAHGGRLAISVCLTCVFGSSFSHVAVAHPGKVPAEVWLQPNSNYEVQVFSRGQPHLDWSKTGSDFQSFFSGTGADNPILSDIKVVKFSPAFISGAPKAELQTIFSWLQTHHIELAVGVEILELPANACGRGIEGYSANLGGFLSKLKQTRADVHYFVMDEPFYFSSQATEPGACRFSQDKTAREVFDGVTKIKALFPYAKIGEIEPIPQTHNLAQWLNAYYQVGGQYPDVFIADVSWKQVSDTQLATWSTIVRERHIKFGMIYNAANTTTDQDWENATLNHTRRINETSNIDVDIALFQSWSPYPTRLLPVTRPGTMANVIEQYMRQK